MRGLAERPGLSSDSAIAQFSHIARWHAHNEWLRHTATFLIDRELRRHGVAELATALDDETLPWA
ncbi:MAG: hypothetical protein IT182_06325 [Acidobacteria bacterium]|nr:hypothetical protein [Acidobacteriota bacterium]